MHSFGLARSKDVKSTSEAQTARSERVAEKPGQGLAEPGQVYDQEQGKHHHCLDRAVDGGARGELKKSATRE